jgi:ElaA protein
MSSHINWVWKKFDELTNFELYQIIRARESVFIVEQKLNYIDCDDYDQKAWHLSGYIDNEIVAYLRAFPQGTKHLSSAAFGRVLTSKEYRRLGYGRELTEMGIKKIKNDFGECDIQISAQAYLQKFYSDFGFKIFGNVYIEEGLPHIQMILNKERNKL